jgi:hypothetical protein
MRSARKQQGAGRWPSLTMAHTSLLPSTTPLCKARLSFTRPPLIRAASQSRDSGDGGDDQGNGRCSGIGRWPRRRRHGTAPPAGGAELPTTRRNPRSLGSSREGSLEPRAWVLVYLHHPVRAHIQKTPLRGKGPFQPSPRPNANSVSVTTQKCMMNNLGAPTARVRRCERRVESDTRVVLPPARAARPKAVPIAIRFEPNANALRPRGRRLLLYITEHPRGVIAFGIIFGQEALQPTRAEIFA